MKENNLKIGLSFSGGGTRAVAQIGAIKALRENGIEAEAVAGTSGGSIVAALYAAGKTLDEMLEVTKEANIYKLFRPGLPARGLTSLDFLTKIIKQHVPEDSFESLFMPCHLMATNLMTGKPEILNQGSLSKSVTASCSIPLLFKPVEIDGQLYADGGIFDNMPVAPLRQDCDIVIGVNIIPNVEIPKKNLESLIAIGMRVFDLMVYNTTQHNFSQCDVVIQPDDLYKYNILDFNNFEKMYKIGYEAAKAQIPEILRVIEVAEQAK